MSLFDTVHCQVSLPEAPENHNGRFQTKDLLCELRDYTITEAGHLILEPSKSVYFDNDPQVDPVDTEFHGDLELYDCISDEPGNPNTGYTWYEYQVRFTEGQLVRANLVHRYHRNRRGRVDEEWVADGFERPRAQDWPFPKQEEPET